MRRAIYASVVAALMAAPALAKLPAPSDEAKAKADEAKARTDWSDKVAAFKLCQSQDRTAEHYRKTAPALGKTVSPAVATPACADPGAFTYTAPPAASAPPLEAAGAHSPTATAAAPPSSKATAAEQQGKVKK